MPSITRWFIKTAIVYFIAALLAGVALAARGVVSLPPVVVAAGPAFLHLLTVGWITQMIFGVAYWMFPRASRERPRNSAALALATYIMLNAGIVLRVVYEPLYAVSPGPTAGWLLTASGVLQLAAGLAFVANTWGRVKGK